MKEFIAIVCSFILSTSITVVTQIAFGLTIGQLLLVTFAASYVAYQIVHKAMFDEI